jgi:hypothetical protein
MDRFVLTDAQWAKMEPHCLGKPSDPGRSGSDNRLFVEAVLWVARTGSPWRDLPKQFGKAVNGVIAFFMALLSFRGISTPSLPAQGEQRRSSYFNIPRGNPCSGCAAAKLAGSWL